MLYEVITAHRRAGSPPISVRPVPALEGGRKTSRALFIEEEVDEGQTGGADDEP